MIKIVTYNIQFGFGRDNKNNLDRIIESVNGADVIALQEVDRFWLRSGNCDQVKILVNSFPKYDFAFGPSVEKYTGRLDSSGRPIRSQFGNLLISKEPIIYCRHHLLPKSASIGPLSIQRSALECLINLNGTMIRFLNTHLSHVSSNDRYPQVRKLLRIHKDAVYEGAPVCGANDGKGGYWAEAFIEEQVSSNTIILGDFNCTPDSPEYELMVGAISPYGGRVTHPLGFVDSWEKCSDGAIKGFTSEVKKIPSRLDYIFMSTCMSDRIKKCWIDTSSEGSDHQPVWLELTDNIDLI